MPSPYQFTYFQGGGFDASLLSFLQIDREGSVNVSKLGVRPHVTAGAGGFVDITAQAKRIVFSGYFTAGGQARRRAAGSSRSARRARSRSWSPTVEHVSFSGRRAVAQGQDITYVTERCVMKLTRGRRRRHRDRAGRRSRARRPGAGGVPADRRPAICRPMDAALFQPEPDRPRSLPRQAPSAHEPDASSSCSVAAPKRHRPVRSTSPASPPSPWRGRRSSTRSTPR